MLFKGLFTYVQTAILPFICRNSEPGEGFDFNESSRGTLSIRFV